MIPNPRPRLLAFNQYYRPGPEADGELLAQLCESLAAEYDVTVVTGRAPGALRVGRERVGGVSVVRVPSTVLARSSSAGRAANYLSYSAGAVAVGLAAARPDIVLSFTNPPFVPLLARLVARRSGAPLVVVSQDVFPETALALGELRASLAVRAFAAATRSGLAGAARVVAIGETMRYRLEAKGVAAHRIRVIPNWVDTAEIAPAPPDNDWARGNRLAERFVVMHSGNVGYAQDLDSLVRAAALLDDLDDLVVSIVGSGARRAALVRLAQAVGARRVRFLPYQPRSSLSQSLSAGTLHVVGLACGLAGYVVPSRVLGVLAAGRPVVAAVEEASETAALVTEAGCGVVVPPGDPDALAAAIRDAHDGRIDLEELGRRGREWVVRNADRAVAVTRYRELLREVRCS